MLSLTARSKVRVALSFVLAALLACFAFNYSPDLAASFAAGKRAAVTKRGPATIVLQEARELPAVFERARPSTRRATALASADLDADGYPDLISGYAAEEGGYVVIQRGDPEAFAPTREENIQAFNESRFLDSFLPQTQVVELADAPEFVAAGDFDRDNDVDLVTAKRGGTELNFVAGNGRGEFSQASKIALSGRVTTLASGQIDRNDGSNDLVVGVEHDGAASLLVFEDVKGGIFGTAANYDLPSAAQAVVMSELDGTTWKDAAILAGGDVFVLHGRNQSDGVESAKRAASRLERIDLPFVSRAITVGDFIWDRDGRMELALLRDDGSVVFVSQGELDMRPFTVSEARDRRRRQMLPVGDPERIAGPATVWRPDASRKWKAAEEIAVVDPGSVGSVAENSSEMLFAAKLSGQAADDLVILDSAMRQIKVFAVEAPAKDGVEFVSHAGPRALMALPTSEAPVAALSMRTSLFVRPGLVFLKHNSDSPEIIPAAPSATFTVDRTDDVVAGGTACTGAANDCSLRGAHIASNGAAGADTITIPAGTFTKTIVGNDDGAAQGDLDVTESVTLSGVSAATTIIQSGTTSSNGIDKTIGFNPLCTSPVSGTINNVTVRFGNNTQPNGSIDFSHTGGGMDFCSSGNGATFSITNSTFDQNTVNNSYGGGINIDSISPSVHTINITNCTISNNDTVNSASAAGGGIHISGGEPTIVITGSTITGNRARLTGNDGLGGGIAYRINTGPSSLTINTSTISNNNSASSGGGIANIPNVVNTNMAINNSAITGNTSNGNGAGSRAEGGGYYSNSFTPVTTASTITESTITGNTAVLVPTGGTHIGGGGIAVGAGDVTISFSRIVGNTATSGSGLRKDNNAGTAAATNNWWGCSGGPGTTGCQTAVVVAGGTLTTSPFLQLRTSAAPTTILVGQGSALSTSFLLNSSGGGVAVSNLDALIGQTVTWSGVNGSISGAQTTIQAAGTATATYTGTSEGGGSATAVVDGGPASGSLNTVAISVTNTATWDGSTSSNWNTATNWTTDFVPLATNNVDLPAAGVTNQANLSAADATVANLTVGANRTLTISGARTLTVNGLLTMNGLNIDATAGLLEIGGAGTVTRTSGVVLGPMRKVVTSAPIPPDGSSPAAPAFIFVYPVGTSTGFSPLSANFTAGSGALTVAAVNGTAPSTPALSDLTTLDRYWQLTETGALTASLTFTYLQADIDGTEANYRMIRSSAATPPIRFANGTPCPGAGSPCVDGSSAAGGTIFAGPVQSFDNFWTAGEPVAPTAANVTVTGRVFAEGRALRGAIVTLTRTDGVTVIARTSAFGYYTFSEVESGRDYVISVSSKNFTFAPRVVAVNDSLADVDFFATP